MNVSLLAGGSGDRITMGTRYSAPVQTGPVANAPPVWIPGHSCPVVKELRSKYFPHDNNLLHAYSLHLQRIPCFEDNRFAASQEIPRILWNPKVNYRIHKCPPTLPLLNQLDPVHILHILLPS